MAIIRRSEPKWPAHFKAVTEHRYYPHPRKDVVTAIPLCDVRHRGSKIIVGTPTPILAVIDQTSIAGWHRVGFMVQIGKRKHVVPATIFVVGEDRECPNHPEGVYLVDWWYGDEGPYIERKKTTK